MEKKTIEQCVADIDEAVKTLKFWLAYNPAMEVEQNLIDLQEAEQRDGNFKN